MNVLGTILPVLLLLLGAASVVMNQMAWRDFGKRKFSSFEEKQKFRKMLSWTPWGAYRYLCVVRKKEPVLLPYIKILSAIALLLLIWIFGSNASLGPRLIITAVVFASLFANYFSKKIPFYSTKKPTTKS